MTLFRTLAQLTALISALFLTSCAIPQKPGDTTTAKDETFKNPYPAGTYDHFKADPKYPKTYNVWKNEEVLAKTDASNSRIVINLAKQRGFLMKGDEVAIDYPICSGTAERPTPRGTFPIKEKIVDKSSNTYGKILDASGDVVNGNADINKDPIPEGGKFVGAPMRYWMRMTGDGVGHHIGPIRRYPASHACVRGPGAVMPIIYSKVRVGTPIIVE
ncbi:MAG: L,D-transpeptidase [Luteolibacter sp.]